MYTYLHVIVKRKCHTQRKKQPVSDLDKSLQEVLGINITLEHSHLSLVDSYPATLAL